VRGTIRSSRPDCTAITSLRSPTRPPSTVYVLGCPFTAQHRQSQQIICAPRHLPALCEELYIYTTCVASHLYVFTGRYQLGPAGTREVIAPHNSCDMVCISLILIDICFRVHLIVLYFVGISVLRAHVLSMRLHVGASPDYPRPPEVMPPSAISIDDRAADDQLLLVEAQRLW
jgi:hypothetical protein